jgi:TP901 family phage tail tape measure protein
MANKRLNATLTIGGAVTASLRNSLGLAKNKIADIGGALRDLERQQRKIGGNINAFGRLGANVDVLRAKYAGLTVQIEKARRQQALMQSKAAAGTAARGAGMALGVIGAVASVGLAPVIQFAQFEKAMSGVSKQVEGARDESGKLTSVYYDMAKQIQKLGREIPLTTNELASMVAAGARMGIAKDELISFTRTAATMAAAFELPAAELADQMGKIATLYKIPIPAIGSLADTINYLDDNAISKGGDIIDVLKRIGGTAQMVKMPAKEAAALASTFLTLGSSAEVAGTASNAMMRELSIATMQPKRFKAGLAAIKMDAKTVQAGMAKDATGTILKVLEAINKIPQEQRLTVATQLYGKEYGDDVSKLAEGIVEYRRQLALAKSDKAVGSMGREARAQASLVTSQWQMAKNQAVELGVNIGSVLLPAVNGLFRVMGPLVSKVADFVRENSVLVGNVATAGAVILGSLAGWKLLALGVAAVKWAFVALKLAMATNPIGLILIGLATAGALIYKNWDPIKAYFTNWFASVKATFTNELAWIIAKIDWIGTKVKAAKEYLGFGSNEPTGGAGPRAVPQMKQFSPGGGQQVNNFHLTQQPGESNEDLARRVAKEFDKRRGVNNRSMMYDGVTP